MKKLLRLYGGLLLLQVILALVCGPYSCEWGNEVYLLFGMAALVVSFLLPLWQKQWPIGKRLLFGALFLLGSALFWCLGFGLGSFRLMCRMF